MCHCRGPAIQGHRTFSFTLLIFNECKMTTITGTALSTPRVCWPMAPWPILIGEIDPIPKTSNTFIYLTRLPPSTSMRVSSAAPSPPPPSPPAAAVRSHCPNPFSNPTCAAAAAAEAFEYVSLLRRRAAAVVRAGLKAGRTFYCPRCDPNTH